MFTRFTAGFVALVTEAREELRRYCQSGYRGFITEELKDYLPLEDAAGIIDTLAAQWPPPK